MLSSALAHHYACLILFSSSRYLAFEGISDSTCIMSTALLTCKICSKKPSFSDVSHLLTHVGSKGHLSQLHKLQVKSHQEIAEALQLVDYNQWYQEHGLAQLLSERLQQKEKKQAAKQGVKKENVVKIEDDSAEAQPVRQKARSRGRAKVKRDDDEVNEPARSA